ncbi:MAG: DUF3293 domain-containing protein [Gammaproteobacteria bacterium]|nr:DUF3293 domain-containing protein [Gammaproteobacteria bacterium]
MHETYRDTRFRQDAPPDYWPAQFVIITAYPPVGETWSQARIDAAEVHLTASLTDMDRWMHRLMAYSTATGATEPGWAVEISTTKGAAIARRFLQDAIFMVEDDMLWVVDCDDDAVKTCIGRFSERLDSD